MKLRYFAFILLTVYFTALLYAALPGSVAERLLFALIIGGLLGALVFPLAEMLRRLEKGIDLFATLESDPQVVKDHMLFIMQWGHEGGIVGTLKEFNTIFRNYPDWELDKWEVFRAWYKYEIDFMFKRPEIYHMTMKADGSPYSKEADPLYDPNAPDWEQFDRDHSQDCDDDDLDDDDYQYDDKHKKKRTPSEAISLGIGIALGNSMFGGSMFGGGNSSGSGS